MKGLLRVWYKVLSSSDIDRRLEVAVMEVTVTAAGKILRTLATAVENAVVKVVLSAVVVRTTPLTTYRKGIR